MITLPFLISSGFLFLAGLPMVMLGWIPLVGWILLLMGGIPLLMAWGHELLQVMETSEAKQSETQEEESQDENL